MLKKYSLHILLFIAFIFGTQAITFAQDQIEKTWYNTKKTGKIQIYKAVDGKFYGKIVWLAEPNRDGKPKTDIHNTDEARRKDPVIGLLILKGFNKDGANDYENGTIYDPQNGKTYKCKMTIDGNKLAVRGYIGFSMLGRTENWTKAD